MQHIYHLKYRQITLAFLSLFYCLSFINAQTSCIGERGKIEWFQFNTEHGYEVQHMTHEPKYPMNYDRVRPLEQLTFTEERYADYYYSLVRGYIRAVESGDYIFNVTGDDRVFFYLSTDTNPENKVELSKVTGATAIDGHDARDHDQQTDTVTLAQNQYYYFELLHGERGGGDHFSLYWKRPGRHNANYQVVPTTRIYDYACDPSCPEKGTPCDDGDPQTDDDVQDGFCNCFGTPRYLDGTPSCVGEKGFLDIIYYDDVPGYYTINLLYDSKFPSHPTRADKLTISKTEDSDIDNYGAVVKGFLSVPVSGDYYFNVTGYRQFSMKLSPNEDPAQAATIAYYNSSAISDYDHDKEEVQTSQAQYLEKGKLYYMELIHKANTGYDRFQLFWRTPFHGDSQWRLIDDVYFYSYDCEIACMPDGTPCDDGSALTVNDTINNCLCVGVPCPDGNCDPPVYEQPEACGVSDELDDNGNGAWLTCKQTISPNPDRGTGQWIQYDLGTTNYIHTAHIWNYNAAGDLGKGFKEVAIDYSIDGTTWETLGAFNWAQGTGTKGYKGLENNLGIKARYILFTALSNWGDDPCSGISKITFDVNQCLQVGQPCNDGNGSTSGDKFNIDCECVGEQIVENICSKENRYQGNIPIEADNYDARREIETAAIVSDDFDVSFVAGKSITFKTGFHAKAGSNVVAMIEPCPIVRDTGRLIESKTVIRPQIESDYIEVTELTQETSIPTSPQTTLLVMPNPVSTETMIQFNLPTTTPVTLSVYTTDGKLVTQLVQQTMSTGIYSQLFPVQKLTKGIYFINLKTDTETLTERLIVVE